MSAVHAEALAAIGFEPISVDIKDFVEQIGTDRFQAQENPLTNTFHFGVQRLHRFITLSGHFFGASAFICNAKLFESWPHDVRQAVEAAAQEATRLQRALAAQEDSDVLARIDPRENEVITLSAAERAKFVEAVEPVVARQRKELDPKLFEYLS
jgi:TRAP-type C4-dicarboxylate transport system substrate-binding protein